MIIFIHVLCREFKNDASGFDDTGKSRKIPGKRFQRTTKFKWP